VGGGDSSGEGSVGGSGDDGGSSCKDSKRDGGGKSSKDCGGVGGIDEESRGKSGIDKGSTSDDSSHEVEDKRKDPRQVDRGKCFVAEMAGRLGGKGVGSKTDLGQF